MPDGSRAAGSAGPDGIDLEAIHDLAILEVAGPREFSQDLQARIEELWRAEQARRSGTLTDDPILSLAQRRGSELRGWFTSYRNWIAQLGDPELFEDLAIRPVAVSGVLRLPEGIVFGRRSPECTQDAGLWELPPSGGITTRARRPDKRISGQAQLLMELEEELAVPASAVQRIAPLAVTESRQTRVCNIVFDVSAGVPFDAVACAPGGEGREHVGEYVELRVVRPGDLEGFRRDLGAEIAPVSREVLCLIGDRAE